MWRVILISFNILFILLWPETIIVATTRTIRNFFAAESACILERDARVDRIDFDRPTCEYGAAHLRDKRRPREG